MKIRLRSFYSLPLLLFILILAFGCGKPVVKCESPEDNPAHHYLRWMELLEDMKLDEAGEKFERSVYCDEGYGPAFGGLAIVAAYRSAGGIDPALKKDAAGKSYTHLKRSGKNADTPEEEYAWRVASIRVGSILKPRGWIEDAES
ncbi:MAG: S-layer homology domain-containing protein, partial [Deltaproteobacteria bacterium]|nr:S-layer homology domain-containing protein [Deltaproteobacteria bacterium]